jgi:hypothetical protein
MNGKSLVKYLIYGAIIAGLTYAIIRTLNTLKVEYTEPEVIQP